MPTQVFAVGPSTWVLGLPGLNIESLALASTAQPWRSWPLRNSKNELERVPLHGRAVDLTTSAG